jgi:hypothetical protein
MTSRTKLYVIARWHKDQPADSAPHSYLQVWGSFYAWVSGIHTHCRFDYEECYHHYVAVTTPGDIMYQPGQWRICGFIAPLRKEPTE